MNKRVKTEDSVDDIRAAFKSIDESGNGTLSFCLEIITTRDDSLGRVTVYINECWRTRAHIDR